MLPTLLSQSLPFTLEARTRGGTKTNKTRKEHSLCVLRWGWFLKYLVSLCKNRFWYVTAWLFFNTFFTHVRTTWKKMHTPMEQVLEVKNTHKMLQVVRYFTSKWATYSLVFASNWYFPLQWWDGKEQMSRQCYKSFNRIYSILSVCAQH